MDFILIRQQGKHQIKVKDRKSALVRMSFQEMAYGIGGKRM